MDLVEIRDLDGPNLFTLRPAIKVELVLAPSEQLSPESLAPAGEHIGVQLDADPVSALTTIIRALHAKVGEPPPETGARRLDAPGHVAVFFTWEWRTFALLAAQLAFDSLSGRELDHAGALRAALEADGTANDRPLWVRDSERSIPTVGITGTNGKTTTTRLVAHIARSAGRSTGWSSSSGVYINGEQVLEGDYTGPSGARRVLEDPGVEVAILETARGGILLRGIAYESNDVGVMLNVTSDHLSMQGVETLNTLAEVKSVVVRVTRPDGLVVLNADDPLVAAYRDRVRAEVLLFSQQQENSLLSGHVAAGGKAITREGGEIIFQHAGVRQRVIGLDDVPLTWGGVARHMVENTLAACGAAMGLGFDIPAIAGGLRTFRSDVRSNAGRLNVFRLHGRIIVVDYAHNESGLEALIEFTRALMGGHGRLVSIIGTAGDRRDDVLVALGKIAAERSDSVYIKENLRYLRGRQAGEIVDLLKRGVLEAGARARLAGVFPSEHAALLSALDRTEPGDAIAIMCVQDQLAIYRELRERGAEEWR